MTKIAFFEIEPWEEKYIKENLKGHDLAFFDEELDEKSAKRAKDFDIVSVFVHSEVTFRVVNQLRKVRSIITRSTGFDHIDLNACEKQGIVVCNTPYYGENTVAEYTFALILSLSRQIPEALEKTKKKDFSLEGLRGFDLKGKTLGIIGLGHIGSKVARMAKGFEMNVITSSKVKDKSLGVKKTSLKELLKKSDIVTLHVPLVKSTYHLINKKNIRYMKKGSYLINTSRGEVVDTTAVIEALDKGILEGAGLDVIEGEDLIKEQKQMLSESHTREDLFQVKEVKQLLKNPKVIITPHNAFNTKEALQRILDTAIENIKCAIKGKGINLVE